MLLLISILVFLLVMCLCVALILRSGFSPLAEKFKKIGKGKQKEKEAFLDVLWGIPPALRNDTSKIAVIFGVLGFIAGLIFNPAAALFFGLILFVMSPRVKNYMEENRKKSKFFKQFPRAVAELASVARTGTLKEGFEVIKREHPSPVSDVFGFIAEAMTSNMTAYKAVKAASEQYGYPGLDKLADAVRIISELGGGENAAETLSSAAEHIRFLERFRGKIDAAVGGIIYEMLISTGVVILYFFLTSGPWTEGWQGVVNHPGVVAAGFLALAVGWYLSLKRINDFKNRSYI